MGNAESLSVICCDAAETQPHPRGGQEADPSPRGVPSLKSQEGASGGGYQHRVLHFKPAKLASSPLGGESGPLRAVHVSAVLPGGATSQSSENAFPRQRLGSAPPGQQPLLDGTSSGQRMVPLSPGQPLVDAPSMHLAARIASSGPPQVSGASALASSPEAAPRIRGQVSSMPPVRLTQAERDFGRGSSSPFNTPSSPSAPMTPQPYDAPPPASNAGPPPLELPETSSSSSSSLLSLQVLEGP